MGLNEVSSQFLPKLYRLLEHVAVISQTKASLHQMRSYLVQNQQTLGTMTAEQAAAYKAEKEKLDQTSTIVADTLITFGKFCQSMPLEWIISPQQDMLAAFLFLIREPEANIQVHAVECVEQLSLRGKFTYDQWLKLLNDLPGAINAANQQFVTEQEYAATEAAVSRQESRLADPLTAQYSFHRSLSKLLATVVSSHTSHVTYNDKRILKKGGPDWNSFSGFLRVLTDMLHHPSGRIASEQLAMWVALLRDTLVTRAKLLQPFLSEVLTCYMDALTRVRWEDVDEQTHPQANLMEASWEDEDEYDSWLMEFRSKSSQLFKYIGNCEPRIAAETISARVQRFVTTYGNGEPRDYLNSSNQQLTLKSSAVNIFEAIIHPMENILIGLPKWSVESGQTDGNKAQTRESVQASLSQLAQTIVSWNPSYLFLKFRKAQLLENLRHYWMYDPSTLLQAIDSLLGYLRAPDEWGVQGSVSKGAETVGTIRLSGETVSLRKKSTAALVSIAKQVPKHLVPWLSQLSEATRGVLSSEDLIPTNRMHLYEFLSCVATAVDDPALRANFVGDVLSDAMNVIESQETKEAIASVDSFLAFVGVGQAAQFPESVTDPSNVALVQGRFARVFSALNQLLSVGKRCSEAAKKRPNGLIPPHPSPDITVAELSQQNFPDEGPVSISDLAMNDPFVSLWPRIFPILLQTIDIVLRIWRPEQQSVLLRNKIQRYALAMSDDEVYLSRKGDGKSGGVFGEGGTAGSVIPGVDRRDQNLAPKWSGWFNELRNTCLQLLGLAAGQRVIFAPEMSGMFPQFVSVVTDAENIRAMEHRHFTQYLKQFIEILMLACPFTLYMTHLAPVLSPVLEHVKYRLDRTWAPLIGTAPLERCKPLFTSGCDAAATLAAQGGDAWFDSYYARTGLFVGDLEVILADSAVEKQRVENCRVFADMLQAVLGLKGDWALVLANLAREDQAVKRNDSSKLTQGPSSKPSTTDGYVNADGTPRSHNQTAVDARKLRRINAMCHFLLLEHEQIAGNLTLAVIDCLSYPDAYTCRRVTRICHRITEATAWYPRYTDILGTRMFMAAVKNIVTEPKWMVGIEWEMINVARDIYIRLILGQYLQPGGQGVGLQQPRSAVNPNEFEQAKSADRPLQGGGILTVSSDLPRQVLMRLPGINVGMINQLEADLKRKRSAKDQKDFIRDFLRIAADNLKENDPGNSSTSELFGRAGEEESLLHRDRKPEIAALPEELVTFDPVKNRALQSKKKKENMSAFSIS